jgi:hypothetical protein
VEDDTGVWWAQLYYLIIIAKGGHSCCLMAHVCRVAMLVPCKVILYSFESPRHPRLWVRLVNCCHSIEVLYHHGHMRLVVRFKYDYLVVEINDTKIG